MIFYCELLSLLVGLAMPLQAQTLDQKVKEWRDSKMSSLAPPVVVSMGVYPELAETTDSLGHSEYYEVKGDSSERPKPWVIKISQTKYLLWRNGEILIHTIEHGAEQLFDAFWGIQLPPEPPKGGDNSDYWKSDNDRWEWKP